MKSIYYAICFVRTDSTGRTIGHEDPTKKGAWGLFYSRGVALLQAETMDKIVPVRVTIEPVKAKKRGATKKK